MSTKPIGGHFRYGLCHPPIIAPSDDQRQAPFTERLPLIDLQAAINRYLTEHNHSPKPFTWAADPDRIIAAANRGYQVLDSIH